MIIKDTDLYRNEIEIIKQELYELTGGNLTKNGPRYYETQGTIQKGITKDQQRIKQLARKAYLSRRLKNLEWNCSLTEKQSGRYRTEDPVEIVKELSSAYQTLPIDYFFHHFVDDKLKKLPEGNVGYIDELVYVTLSGINVRSKSERTIADAFYQNKIPFRYEAALAIGGEVRYPDFVISRPFDGKIFLWEHFGLMNNDGYRQKAIDKMVLYAKYGFFSFDNLICTYENDLLNPAYIYSLINTFLLS